MSVVPKMAESYTSMANYNKQVFRGAINPLRSNNYNGRTDGRFVDWFVLFTLGHQEFNWHPLLMTVSLVYLYGTGVLVYRVLRNERKRTLKLVHAIGRWSTLAAWTKW